ncbi:MAG: hypothetical protein JSV09_11335 [Thermoplasmata archaeon]|nr:MAG: hypothetical protein JSV09_11335 [Thermoplasmata archaeon]
MGRKVIAIWLSLTMLFSFIMLVNEISFNVEAPTTLFVGGGGDGNYSKIQWAIDNANYGDTVFVYYGFYEENLTLKDGISLIGEMPQRPTLDGTNIIAGPDGKVIFYPANDTRIEGFNIHNANRGIMNRGCKNVTVSRNIFRDISWSGIHNWDGASSIITNNVFYKISYAVYSVQGSGGSKPSNDTIANNVFDFCYSYAIYGPSGIQRIVNNVFVECNYGIGHTTHSKTYYGYNLFWNNSEDYYGTPPGENDTFADPNFTDFSYHIGLDSPAIDNGTSKYAPVIDMDGDTRPFDGDGDKIKEFDIGIDENISSAQTIFLYSGWNLISIPYIQPDTDLSTVLSSISGSYDAIQRYNASDTNGPWKHNCSSKPSHLNDLGSIHHTSGFWIHITELEGIPFQYYGLQPTQNQTINLDLGWNMVGYPSLTSYNRTEGLYNLTFDQEIDLIQWYDAQTKTWHDLNENDYFVPGRGYWIHAKVECEWEVPL